MEPLRPKWHQVMMILALALSWNGIGCGDDASSADNGFDFADSGSDTAEDAEQDMAVPENFRLVRITDLSMDMGSQDAGADIDAVILETAAGGFHYAEMVLDYDPSMSDNVDTSKALGSPDAFVGWENTKNTSSCSLTGVDDQPTYVSLGGDGYIVVQMEGAIREGDTLTVLEVGGCDTGDGEARVEEIRVEIAVAGATSDDFKVVVSNGRGPTVQTVITASDLR